MPHALAVAIRVSATVCVRRSAARARLAGFSLIELMVVIVIIGLVAALAVPSMGVSRFDRHVYDDAGSVMQLLRSARIRAIARGGAVLVAMSANGVTDRGTFTMYEAVTTNVLGGVNRTPVASCKAPTVWNLAAGNPNVLMIDGVNLNGTIEANADIETQAFIYTSPTNSTATAFSSGFICYTPLGRSYLVIGLGPPVFNGTLPAVSPLELRVTRANGGNYRSVLVPPNGMARLFSHT